MEETPTPRDFVLPVVMVPTEGATLPLGTEKATVRQGADSEQRDLPVQLRHTHFVLTNLVVRNGRARQVPLEADCYELRPLGEGLPLYRWSFWWHEPPYSPRWFWLFNLSDDETYLAFTPGAGLYLANVTYPRDRLISFHEDFGQAIPKACENVPAGLVAEKGGKPESSWSFADGIPLVVPTSLTRDRAGDLRLSVSFTRGKFGGVLVKKEAGWECVEFDAEASTRPQPGGLGPPPT
jgi:hypothetical protein